MILPLIYHRKVKSSLMLFHSPHVSSSCRHFVISHHHKKHEYNMMFLERDTICITFITVYCYNFFYFLIVSFVNLLLYLVLICISLIGDVEHLCVCVCMCVPVGHLHILLGKISIQNFCPLINCFFFFFDTYVLWSIYVFWILTSWSYYLHIFLPFHRLSFHFVNGFLRCATFLFDISFVCFCFSCLRQIQRNIAKTDVKMCFTYVVF